MARTLPHKRRAGPEDAEIGRRIRARRLQCGLSQTALADRLGITFQQVQKYEKGINRVGAGRMHAMCEALGVPITFFYSTDHLSRPAFGEQQHGSSLFGLLQRRDALQLATAFRDIPDRTLRRAVLKVVTELAMARKIDRR